MEPFVLPDFFIIGFAIAFGFLACVILLAVSVELFCWWTGIPRNRL